MGWRESRRPADLGRARFDVFVTVDKNLPYQQNLQTLPVAVVLLSAVSNELSVLEALVPELERALLGLRPGSFVQVGP